MKTSDIIDELKTFYRDGVKYSDLDRHLAEVDIQRWITTAGWSRSQFFSEIAKELALGFVSSELSYEFCNAVVNDLFGPVTDTSGPKPGLFWEVYYAFDEGEYYHGNNRDEDPIEAYTRPMIAKYSRRFQSDLAIEADSPEGNDRKKRKGKGESRFPSGMTNKKQRRTRLSSPLLFL